MQIEPIAHFHSPFSTKFGIPKQSGLVAETEGTIVFTPAYRNADYIRGLEDFDFIWLLWGFSANPHRANSPVVRPPVLGGNKSVGVFASRSPFRPNAIGLSSVRIERVERDTNRGPVIHVRGADLMDGTPIYDIKPYLEYTDSHTGIRNGFTDNNQWERLHVTFPDELRTHFTPEQTAAIIHALELDPRPHYQNNPQKTYGMPFAGHDIHFRVENGILTVVEVCRLGK